MDDAEQPEVFELYQRGLEALRTGHADEAIVPLERARKLEPGSMSITEALGQTYLKLRFYDRAIAQFAEILEKEPLDDYAHYCIARAYDRTGEWRMAARHYRLAAFFRPARRLYRDTLEQFLVRAQEQGLFDPEDEDADSA
jgi:tetratricopeptide (TPR) repeat protein